MTRVSGYYDVGHRVFPSNISSSSNQLLVTFTSDEYHSRRGFKLKIHEELKHGTLSADDCSVENPCDINHGHCQSDDECEGYLKCGHDNCNTDFGYPAKSRCCYDYCSQWLEYGSLASPWFPDYYPTELRCQTLITVGMIVAGPRTITLEFLHFKVDNTGLIRIFRTLHKYFSFDLF